MFWNMLVRTIFRDFSWRVVLFWFDIVFWINEVLKGDGIGACIFVSIYNLKFFRFFVRKIIMLDRLANLTFIYTE